MSIWIDVEINARLESEWGRFHITNVMSGGWSDMAHEMDSVNLYLTAAGTQNDWKIEERGNLVPPWESLPSSNPTKAHATLQEFSLTFSDLRDVLRDFLRGFCSLPLADLERMFSRSLSIFNLVIVTFDGWMPMGTEDPLDFSRDTRST